MTLFLLFFCLLEPEWTPQSDKVLKSHLACCKSCFYLDYNRTGLLTHHDSLLVVMDSIQLHLP